MFLITGITGKVGGAAAKHLLSQNKSIRALVRDEAKAKSWADQGVELLKGEWEDADALARALSGVEGAYLMMPPIMVPSPDFWEAKALLASYQQALAQAPPPRVVALSSIGAQQTSGLGLVTVAHLFEEALGTLPFPVAFIRAGSFFENYLFGLQTGQGGTLPTFYAPAARRIPMVATDDIGAEVARLLTSAWTGKRVIELGSPTSPADIATAIGEVLGRDVTAQAVPREAWTGALEGMGFPRGGTAAYEEMADSVNSGWIDFGVPGTEPVPGTTSVEEVFRAARG